MLAVFTFTNRVDTFSINMVFDTYITKIHTYLNCDSHISNTTSMSNHYVQKIISLCEINNIIYLETMAAIAPAHRCLVVLTALRPRTLRILCTSTRPSEVVSLSEPLSPFCTTYAFVSATSLPLGKLTDKKQPPAAAGTLVRRRRRFDSERIEVAGINRRKESGIVGSRNNPPIPAVKEPKSEAKLKGMRKECECCQGARSCAGIFLRRRNSGVL